VSYDNQNLGFVKATQGIAKNHYPKGLRREW
jgi:NOL1/NOP2/fmu family ribosome biogenesis protein